MVKNKLKINKSIARRFKTTKRGKLLRRSSFLRHLRSKKSKSQIRNLKTKKLVTGPLARKINKLLGVKSRKKGHKKGK